MDAKLVSRGTFSEAESPAGGIIRHSGPWARWCSSLKGLPFLRRKRLTEGTIIKPTRAGRKPGREAEECPIAATSDCVPS